MLLRLFICLLWSKWSRTHAQTHTHGVDTCVSAWGYLYICICMCFCVSFVVPFFPDLIWHISFSFHASVGYPLIKAAQVRMAFDLPPPSQMIWHFLLSRAKNVYMYSNQLAMANNNALLWIPLNATSTDHKIENLSQSALFLCCLFPPRIEKDKQTAKKLNTNNFWNSILVCVASRFMYAYRNYYYKADREKECLREREWQRGRDREGEKDTVECEGTSSSYQNACIIYLFMTWR